MLTVVFGRLREPKRQFNIVGLRWPPVGPHKADGPSGDRGNARTLPDHRVARGIGPRKSRPSPVLDAEESFLKVICPGSIGQQFCSSHVRQRDISLTHQHVNSFWDRIGKRRDLETRHGDLRIG